ncbi:hypothetical protein NE852_15400 [Rhizobium sp. Pop5]|uniref:hypothetical protein n=1 Tax=Rhizobium sp. Pop5 TaxID=1223565 RepID=UPI0002835669|nr:hypothetical protein [Rhizobium sp. Pop5]EJZ19604.1 hypothetical protein RCCGEPOP_19523 [Rhizobium sp. Pop5]UVD55477.1 hypothetical protein NE852_15400 [Rhizobium sp. Pop5]
MTHFLAKASLAALLALCAIPATVSTAAAAGPQTRYAIEAQYHQPIHGCSPMQAVRKAHYFGLRDVRITRMSPRVVVVAGRDRRGWDRITFANVRGCPLIRR